MEFTDDIAFIDKTRGGVNDRLEACRHTQEPKSFRLSETKSKYLECEFTNVMMEANMEVKIDARVIPTRRSFNYLGSIIQGDEEIDDETHIILERGDEIKAYI